jgi:hypothetical protein
VYEPPLPFAPTEKAVAAVVEIATPVSTTFTVNVAVTALAVAGVPRSVPVRVTTYVPGLSPLIVKVPATVFVAALITPAATTVTRSPAVELVPTVDEVKVAAASVFEAIFEVPTPSLLARVTELPAGLEVRATLIAALFVAAVLALALKVKVDDAASPSATVFAAVVRANASIVCVVVGNAAFEDTVETIPKPKAATATSAIRLIDVFVDIVFLSVVDLRTVRRSAWVLETDS